MKIVFLDIDGVLNSTAWFMRRGKETMALRSEDYFAADIDPLAVEQLNRITRATDASIVVSSTWRLLHKLPDLRGGLKRVGVEAQIISTTPCDRRDRGMQIRSWLESHRTTHDVEAFVVLDDDSQDIPPVHARLVHTHFADGLTAADADRAIEMLGPGTRLPVAP